jgi:mycothiol system anti-sigma-R factor
MAGCDKILEGVWVYLDRELNEAEHKEFEKHLDLCRSCFSHVEFEKKLRDHIRSKTDHMCPEKLKKRIQDLIEKF